MSLDRETVALTFADLAKRLGIQVASAKARAARNRWPRTRANDGRTLVAVPSEALAAPRISAPETTPGIEEVLQQDQRHAADLERMERQHEAEIERLLQGHAAELQRLGESTKAIIEAHRAEAERMAALVERLTEGWAAKLLRLFRTRR